MTSRTKHGMIAALGTFAILAGTASQVHAAEAERTAAVYSDPAATPAAYANYLRSSHEEGAAEALKGFQALPQAEQNKFIDHLHDPALLKSILTKASNQGVASPASLRNASSTTSLNNGEVTIEQERTTTGRSARAAVLPKGNHTVTYNTYVKVFGVKIIKLSLWVNFHSNGRDITKVNSADAGKRNLSGVVSLTKSLPKKSLSNWRFCEPGKPCRSGHNADASVIWEGSVVYQGSTFQVDKKQWMRANVYGKVTDYYLHNV
ncbi:hypothetical protein [Streptomyces chartreusis]|uniref:hypothetical protein n=1 Tax=Streptomyces chartreusis TaxID=1969 RepID=UPI00364DBFD6